MDKVLEEGIYLKNHMIKFAPDSKSLLLYDLKGVLLDRKFIEFLIDDFCIIDDNYILFRISHNIIIKIKIINNNIEINDKLLINYQKIIDFIYIKESKLIIINFVNLINFDTFIGIWDIDSLLKSPIQIINFKSRYYFIDNSHYLFNFNSDLFISFNYNTISIYQKTNNIKLYQLSSILTLNNNYYQYKMNLIKLDNRTIMIAIKNEVYLIDILSIKTKKALIFDKESEIKSLYKKDKDIYLNIGNISYIIKYDKFNLEVINTIEKSIFERKESSFPISYHIIAELEEKIILNNNEPIKFLSFKNNECSFRSESNDYYNLLIEINLLRKSMEILIRELAEIKNHKRNSQLPHDNAQIIFKVNIEKRARISPINYSIITGKRNYDKRKKFKKVSIKNEKIKNNPNKFKKKFR